MSRQFSIQTVLRMTPHDLLAKCFLDLGHSDFDPNWRNLKKQEIEPILGYMAELPLEKLNEVESVLRSVFDVADDGGFHALLEAGPPCGVFDLGSSVPDDLSFYGRAMWVWLHHRKVFERAQIIYRVENISWWRKRSDLPAKAPDTSSAAKQRLEQEISTLLRAQGRGKDCTVETLSLNGIDYFFAYPDDFVQNVTVHNEVGKLAAGVFRQTLLIVFAFDREEGSLELFAKLSKRLKEQLEAIFAREVLAWDLGPHEPNAAYELNQLKSPSFDLRTDPADALRVRMCKMRLSAQNNGRRVLVEVDDDDPDDNMHKAIKECVNFAVTPLSEWNATLVTFCFEFLPLEGRKPGQQTFDVGFPRSCGLRNARPERVELIQKYLKRWKIDCATTPAPSPVAVGD